MNIKKTLLNMSQLLYAPIKGTNPEPFGITEGVNLEDKFDSVHIINPVNLTILNDLNDPRYVTPPRANRPQSPPSIKKQRRNSKLLECCLTPTDMMVNPPTLTMSKHSH